MKSNLTKFLKVSLLATTILSVSVISACKKKNNEPPVTEPQNPLAGYLAATGFNQKKDNFINAPSSYEFGLSFKPLVNGKLTEIVVKIPDINPSLRVTIWDKATATILRTELIAVTSSDTEIIKLISPLDLVKDKDYFISFNSSDYYNRSKTDNSASTYPVTVGDIVITSYAFRTGTAQIMPTNVQTTYYAGDLSFKFQK